jgi:hypothetical protein
MIVILIFEIIINKLFRIIITFEFLNTNFKIDTFLNIIVFKKLMTIRFFLLIFKYMTKIRFFQF